VRALIQSSSGKPQIFYRGVRLPNSELRPPGGKNVLSLYNAFLVGNRVDTVRFSVGGILKSSFQVSFFNFFKMTIHDNMPLSHQNSALILDNEKAICNIHATSIGTFSGILFDMDGTLIDSTNAIVKFWARYFFFRHVNATVPPPFFKLKTNKTPSVGEKYNIDPRTILATSHGRRTIDVFKEIDPSNANWECKIPNSPSLKIYSLIMLRCQ
jgi:hypothetical protein